MNSSLSLRVLVHGEFMKSMPIIHMPLLASLAMTRLPKGLAKRRKKPT
jgi:hypothetical protein